MRLLARSAVFVLTLAAALPARADEGMWLLNKPPLEQLAKHGFKPDAAWLEHAMKSCTRISTGGSGSFVSPDGLVMTNHHVASDMIAKLSTPENDLMSTGFLARSPDQELKCPDLEINVLWEIHDITDRVNEAASPNMSPADANTARRRAMAEIEKEFTDKTGLLYQTVTLYQGGRYHLYGYRRYTDVRLVFAPEKQIAFFGGDADNFEYPRHCLDVTFFRVYENGQPLKTEHFFKWSPSGSRQGDLALVFGHPGSTDRLNTVAHLEDIRDHRAPFRLSNLWRAEVKAQTFAGRSDENARIIEDDLFGIANARKADTGEYAALLDPAVMNRKRAAEQALRSAIAQNPQWQSQWGDAWDAIAQARASSSAWFKEASVLTGINSQLFGFARTIVRLADELPKPSAERLREFRDTNLENVYLNLYSPAPVYPALEKHRVESSLLAMAERLGGDHPAVLAALDGMSPRARAEQLITNTRLIDPAERKRLVEGGKAAVESSEDPLIRLARAMDPEARRWRKRAEDEVEAVERASYAKIAAAKFAVEGENTYPDATFTLRMSFGPIVGVDDIAPYTTFASLYETAAERKGDEQYDLPFSWMEARGDLDLSTPFNFICTADIIGGNSGSPVVNTKGEIIGLIFDGNIDSLGWAYAYDDTRGRSVSVDSRAIIEALRKVYDAGALADELTGR